MTPDAPRRPLGTLAQAAAALALAGLMAGGLGLALGRMGWFKERDPLAGLVGQQTFCTGRVVRLGREGGAAVLVVDAFPAVVTCAFGEPDPRLGGAEARRPGAGGGRLTDPNILAPWLEGCRLLRLPADSDAPDPPIPLTFWLRGGRWWCPEFGPE